jgi:hypothetical protein
VFDYISVSSTIQEATTVLLMKEYLSPIVPAGPEQFNNDASSKLFGEAETRATSS